MSDGEIRRVNLLDSLFLFGESPRTLMHVASLLRFTPPEGAGIDYLSSLVERLRSEAEVQSPWNRKLRHPAMLTTPLQGWVVDRDFDLDYHLRRSALAHPGDERELGVLVSRLHSNQLDLSRPPWEMHVIEGLEDGGFALYVKMHHALVDGYSGMRMLRQSLSTDPDDGDTQMMFELKPGRRPAPAPAVGTGVAGSEVEIAPGSLLSGLLGSAIGLSRGVTKGVGDGLSESARLGSALGQLVVRRADSAMIGPMDAPRTLLNRKIGRNRRFATAQFDLEQIRTIGKATSATVNDVSLAILGGALRRFLTELDDLPSQPLIAFVPVNIRPEGDEGGGNAVGALLASMGTDVADPVARVEAVAASTRAGKAQLQGMSQAAIIAYSGALLSPVLGQAALATASVALPRMAFNVVVSNVPGPRETRYFRGSRLEAMHPVSIPVHGVALNVTFLRYADKLHFGFVGDRDVVPRLQRLAVYADEAMAELSAAIG